VDNPCISGMAEARDFKFYVHIWAKGPNQKYSKVVHRGLGSHYVTYVCISGMAEARELEFCTHVKGRDPNRKYAKMSQRG